MKVLSLFSGCGGLDLGFHKAGFNIIWANDIDKEATETYKKNIADHIVHSDIYDIKKEDLPEEDIDIIMGGFPCLGFTIAKGKHRVVHDEQNFLYKEYVRILSYKKPKYFLVENVPGMMRGEKFRKFFAQMIKDFENEGYRVKHTILNSADYGVPQKRKRVIILGTRNDIKIEPNFPISILSEKEYITLQDAISDLPLEYSDEVPDHEGSNHKVKINNYLGNRPLKWNAPSPTILGRGSRSGGAVIHPHPNLHRRLSVRECARLQSFPDDFIFVGSKGAKYAQIGNAVPPLFAYFIALEFKKLFKDDVDITIPFKLPWIDKLKEKINSKLFL